MSYHLGESIANRLRQLGMGKSDFARRIGVSRQFACQILKRNSIQVDLLATICNVLNYDFLAEIQHGAKRHRRKIFVTYEVDSDSLPPSFFEGFHW